MKTLPDRNSAHLSDRRSGVPPLSSAQSKRQDAASTTQTRPQLGPFPPDRAFSLLEMLVVIAIMAMLMVVAVPSLDYALRGGALSRAGTLLESVIAQARQEALSRNRDVEVRWASWEQPGEGTAWGVQAFRIEREVSGDQSLPIGRLTRLPNTVKVVEKEGGIDYSPLLSSATWSGTNMSIPGVASAATYRAFRLRPDGRLTPLPPTPFQDNNFLSIALKTKAASQNYYTIAINPLTGQILSFRP